MSLDALNKTDQQLEDPEASRYQQKMDEKRFMMGGGDNDSNSDDDEDDSDNTGSGGDGDHSDDSDDGTSDGYDDPDDDHMNFKTGVMQIQKFYSNLSELQQTALILTLMSSLDKKQKNLIKNHLVTESSLIINPNDAKISDEMKKIQEKKSSDANSLIFWQKYFQENHQNPSTIKILEILMDFLPLVNPNHISHGSSSSSKNTSLSLLYHHLVSSVLTAIISSSDDVLLKKGRELLSLALICPCFNDDQLNSLQPFTSKILLKSHEPQFLKIKHEDESVVRRQQASTSNTASKSMRPSSLNLGSDGHSVQTSVSSDSKSYTSTGGLLFSGEGMSGIPAYLKSLRLHKYSSLFSNLSSLSEFLSLNETRLEELGVAAKGARKKFIQHLEKLNERQELLKSLLSQEYSDQILSQLSQLLNTPFSQSSPEVQLIIQLLLKGLYHLFTSCDVMSLKFN